MRKQMRYGGAVATGLLSALVLVGCAETSDGGGSAGGGGGEGLPIGASQEDYEAAFADVDAITVRTQTPAAKGSDSGRPLEDYYAAVEEWSGGKITFDVQYSNAVAQPTEADDALVDGRLDFAVVLPTYEPSEYPANNALIEGGFISDQSPVHGPLSSNAWPNQVAFENDEIMDEFADHGLVPLLPYYNSGPNILFCTEKRTDLASLKGATVGIASSAQGTQSEALGGSPVSVPFTELFESLERGAIDCIVNSPNVAVLGGFAEEAPYVTVDSEAGFAVGPGALAFSQAAWDELPLVARQLLWDKLDVYISSNVAAKTYATAAAMATAVKGAGGGISPLGADAHDALVAANDGLLDQARKGTGVSDPGSLVDAMEDANSAWIDTVAGLGYPDVDWADVDTWFTEEGSDIDLSAYTDELMTTVFGPHRPA